MRSQAVTSCTTQAMDDFTPWVTDRASRISRQAFDHESFALKIRRGNGRWPFPSRAERARARPPGLERSTVAHGPNQKAPTIRPDPHNHPSGHRGHPVRALQIPAKSRDADAQNGSLSRTQPTSCGRRQPGGSHRAEVPPTQTRRRKKPQPRAWRGPGFTDLPPRDQIVNTDRRFSVGVDGLEPPTSSL